MPPPDHLAGKAVACPKCKQPLKIPAANQSAQGASQQAVKQQAPAAAKQPAATGGEKIAAQCQCGAKFAAPPNLAGRKVACPKCKQPVQIPAAKQAPAKPTAPAQAPAKKPAEPEPLPSLGGGGGLDDLLDEVGVEGKQTGESYCPECSAPFVSEEAIICVQCGYNRKTGRKLATVNVRKPPEKAMDLTAPPGGFKPKKEKKKEASENSGKIAIVFYAICGVLVLGLVVGSLFNPQLAIGIYLLGALLTVIASFWVLGVAFQDSAIQGLLVWFVPVYGLVYVAMHFNETKGAVVCWLLGVGIMVLGMVLGGAAIFADMDAMQQVQ